MADRLIELLKRLAKGGGEAARTLTDEFWKGVTGYDTQGLVDATFTALDADKATLAGLPPGSAGMEKDLTAPSTFVSEGGSLNPERQEASRGPETFADQGSPEDAKLVNVFLGQDGAIITKEQFNSLTDQEKTKMLFEITGKETKPWQVDIELSRLLYQAQNIYEKNSRR